MSEVVLKIENLSKQYRLGTVGTGTLSHDLNRWWHQLRGKEDPYLKVGESNDKSTRGESDYVWALKDINMEVKKGEVLGIIGKNGAGKSTLLKILSKVTGPSTGSIKSKGRIASLLEVGTGFHPELTGKENIFLNGAILGMTKAEINSKYDEIVEFSGCERYIDTPVKRYSSGMRVRLAFAVAAFLEPDILVVDEVLAVGDAEFQKKAIGKMKDISSGEGRTVLFVSHNMAAVKSLCSRVILLEKGKIRLTGNTQKVINQYLSTNKKYLNRPLKNIKYRKGNGLLRIIDIESFGLNNKEIPRTGELFKLILSFHILNKEFDIKNVNFDIRIDDEFGQRLIWMSDKLFPKNKRMNKQNVVEFQIDKLNLNFGKYYVTVCVTAKSEVLDWIENAHSFEVSEGDYYGSNILIPKNQSSISIDFKVSHK